MNWKRIKRPFKKIIDFIKDYDEIVKPVSSKLHIKGKKNTFIGGCIYFTISVYLIFCFFNRAIEMITYD